METEAIIAKLEKAFHRFHSKDSVDPKDARIEIYMIESSKGSNEFDLLTFNLFSGSKFIRYVDIQDDILAVLMDPFNKVGIITHFLMNFLITYAQKKNYEPTDCTIVISKDMVQNKIKAIFSTKEGKVHDLTFEEIFATESLIG